MHRYGLVLLFLGTAFARTEFWAPASPPRAHYSVEVRFSPESSRLEGTEIIRFRNDTERPLGRIALRWYGDVLSVQMNGTPAEPSPGKHGIALFDAPSEIAPGDQAELRVEFGTSWELDESTASAITSFLNPVLWWGFGTHDDYEVRLRVPEGYTAATSGRLDPVTGAYRAEGVRLFGLFVGQGYESAEVEAGDVRVRSVFTPRGRSCAELLLKTATDAISFYRKRFGFYPHRSLSIVPGANSPIGGYPAATGLVVVHGQERFGERQEAFWRWITAHEIGHQYWSEHVLARGEKPLSWLMIGLGIYADREYRRAREIDGVGAREQEYLRGVSKGLDTTMDVTEDQRRAIPWDFNNVVMHGKSAAMLSSLESTIGLGHFNNVYRRGLREYAGKQLGWRDFQRLSEQQSGQDLDWFFEQWVRSSKSPVYRIVGQECFAEDAEFTCVVRVERAGSMRMPVTIAARFEDGSEQRARTERLADIDELLFRARAPLSEVLIEPDEAVPMIDMPSSSEP